MVEIGNGNGALPLQTEVWSLKKSPKHREFNALKENILQQYLILQCQHEVNTILKLVNAVDT